MADTEKKPESKSSPVKPEGHDKKTEAKASVPKPEKTDPHAHVEKKTGPAKKVDEAHKRAEKGDKKTTPSKTAKPAAKKDDVKIVDKPTEKKHVPRAKPKLTAEQREGLQVRRQLNARRPWFRRQQWYEYKRLSHSGWRKPTGIDSAMRRHFGYEQSVVRIGFGGPKAVRGLHSSGFQEVYIDQIGQLKAIDTKTQAARISGTLGTRKLKLIYAEADKLGVRILNRRTFE